MPEFPAIPSYRSSGIAATKRMPMRWKRSRPTTILRKVARRQRLKPAGSASKTRKPAGTKRKTPLPRPSNNSLDRRSRRLWEHTCDRKKQRALALRLGFAFALHVERDGLADEVF